MSEGQEAASGLPDGADGEKAGADTSDFETYLTLGQRGKAAAPAPEPPAAVDADDEPRASAGDGAPEAADEHAEGPREERGPAARTPAELAQDLIARRAVPEIDDSDTVYELRSAAERLEEIVLGGKRVLTRRETAKLAGLSQISARKVWRSLGFARAGDDDLAFTVNDVEALRGYANAVESAGLDDSTALSLTRAIGHTTDRLVVWQMESLVEHLMESGDMDEQGARRAALDKFEELLEPLEQLMVYSWRRNLAGALGRLNLNVASGLAMENRQDGHDKSLPLARAIGFVDLVSYTRLSQQMDAHALADLVQHFQGMAHNIIATGHGRVIKTVGDEVFFASETPLGGAEIALSLAEAIKADPQLPKARVGFTWGRVLSRLGDIFGSTVNLAARLVAVAQPGEVLTDAETARILLETDDFTVLPSEVLSLQGFGDVESFTLTRGASTGMKLDIDF